MAGLQGLQADSRTVGARNYWIVGESTFCYSTDYKQQQRRRRVVAFEIRGEMGKEKNRSAETLGRKSHLKGMGRDEMNLAEFPLATLADRVPQGCKTLVFEDQTWDKSQRQHIARRLTISASDKFGLPTALDDEVILGLVQLSKANGFANRQVPFSRYQLVHLLGWREEGKSYIRLEDSLKRWLGVTLYYENAWWDNGCKKWVDAHFHLLDNLTLYHRSKRGECSAKSDDGKPLSSFTWNEVIYRSFQAGHLKSIDLEFYRNLKLAVAKRIYRFLDKHFYFGGQRRYNLARFAWEHIGLSRNYDTAQLKRRLAPAIKELENAGYLKPLPVGERFVCVRRGEWDILFVRAAKAIYNKVELHRPVGLEARLIERGVTASSAVRLVREFSTELIEAKLQVFDQLASRRDARISKNPAGYLVQSIRKDYMPPTGLPKMLNGSVVEMPNMKTSVKETMQKKNVRENKKFYVEQERIQNHLAGLSAEGLAELEIAALKSSPSLLVKSFRRAVDSGSENLAREYRRCLLENHLRTIFRLQETSTTSKA